MKPDQLLNLFTNRFNMTELEGLCFDLGVKHEEIPGDNRTLSAFARNLILFFEAEERLPALIERCRELRPNASWPDDDSLPDFSAWDETAIDEKEMENYLGWVQTQYNTMRVLSMTQPLSLKTIYTDVFLFNKDKYRWSQGVDELEKAFAGRKGLRRRGKRIQGRELLAQANRFFIVGQPGAGKTTFSKWLVMQAAQNYATGQRLPVYLVLHRFNTWNGDLLALLAYELELGGIAGSLGKMKGLLREGKLLILLDGLDEVLAEQRSALNNQIDDLTKWSDDNQIVITCRPHTEARQFERFDYVQMADFTEEQVEHFVRYWFDDDELADSLLSDLRKSEHESIRELTRTPLLLVLLCISYRTKRTFPKRKDQLYERALQVVLRQWDEERGIKRVSSYGQLSLKKKQALLAYVAYATFSQEQLFITEADLAQHIIEFWQNWRQEEIERQKAEYGQVYPPELPSKEIVPQKIIREIVAHHSLLVEQLTGVYSFSHLTLQEYFAALYIVENENLGMVKRLMAHANDFRWRDLFVLVAGLLTNATEFCQLLLHSIRWSVANDSQMMACLGWVEAKATQIQLPYRLVAIRNFLFQYAYHRANSRIIDLSIHPRDGGLTRAFWRSGDRAYEIDNALSSDLSLVLDFFLAIAFTRARDRAFSRGLAVYLDKVFANMLKNNLDRSLSRDLAMQVAERCGIEMMQEDLKALVVPSNNAGREDWEAHVKQLLDVQEKYRDYWDPHRKIQLDEEEIDLFMNLASAQDHRFKQYIDANILLIRCLEVACVPNRQAIEDQILLPPPS